MSIRKAVLALALSRRPGRRERPARRPCEGEGDRSRELRYVRQACDDFYQYANGAWLKAHPIPADRASYGGFQELSDRNREILKKILEETSAKTDWPKGSNEQKVGDFYATGMDEAAIEKTGTKPLAPLFAEIEKLKAPGDLPAVLAELHARGLEAGFTFRVAQDARESTRYIGILGQGGLGLPDRDYYLKDDAKSKDLATAIGARREDVRALRRLSRQGEAVRGRRHGARDEARGALAHARREPRPPEDLQQEDARRARRRGAGLRLPAFFTDLGASSSTEVNVRPAGFFVAFGELARTVPARDWRTYLRWHAAPGGAPLPKASRRRTSRSTARPSTASTEQEPRWRRVQAGSDTSLGEALGHLYVARTFSPQAKERLKRPDREPAHRAERAHRRAAVDERRDQGAGPEEARRRSTSRSAIPTPGATTCARRSIAPRCSATSCARTSSSSNAT